MSLGNIREDYDKQKTLQNLRCYHKSRNYTGTQKGDRNDDILLADLVPIYVPKESINTIEQI